MNPHRVIDQKILRAWKRVDLKGAKARHEAFRKSAPEFKRADGVFFDELNFKNLTSVAMTANWLTKSQRRIVARRVWGLRNKLNKIQLTRFVNFISNPTRRSNAG